MHLLVTGGCGFIGTNFILFLLETDPTVRITNLDKLTYAGNRGNLVHLEGGSRYCFVHGDIADADLVTRLTHDHAVDAIVHFAAESHVDRSITDSSPFIHTNVVGTHTLLEAARRARIPRFVHVSTDEVYGSLGPSDPPFTEDTPLAPNSPYSASKAASDLLARAYHHTYGLPVIITRCSNNYGPYQFPEKLIPLTYLRASQGESVPVYGTGSNVRDWIFVRDHCRGIVAALMRGTPGRVYNFGGDAERSNLETVHTILDILGAPRSLVRFVADRPGHDLRYAMDSSRAKIELGWRPETSFEEGIRATIRWYQEQSAWLQNVQSGAYRQFMETWYAKERGL
jgi:dTDP-glucose 4,6-dehydratase